MVSSKSSLDDRRISHHPGRPRTHCYRATNTFLSCTFLSSASRKNFASVASAFSGSSKIPPLHDWHGFLTHGQLWSQFWDGMCILSL